MLRRDSFTELVVGGTFAVASVAVGADVRRTALQERHGAFEEAKESGCFRG